MKRNRFDLKTSFNEVENKINKEAKARVYDAMEFLRGETLVTLSGPRTGMEYFVPETKTMYTASAPGEPPASPTGRLRLATATRLKTEGGGIVGEIGNPLEYAPELEYGTWRIEPRPWLRPTFMRNKEQLMNMLRQRWF